MGGPPVTTGMGAAEVGEGELKIGVGAPVPPHTPHPGQADEANWLPRLWSVSDPQ